MGVKKSRPWGGVAAVDIRIATTGFREMVQWTAPRSEDDPMSRPQFTLGTLMLLVALAAAVMLNVRVVLDFLESLPHSQYSR